MNLAFIEAFSIELLIPNNPQNHIITSTNINDCTKNCQEANKTTISHTYNYKFQYFLRPQKFTMAVATQFKGKLIALADCKYFRD